MDKYKYLRFLFLIMFISCLTCCTGTDDRDNESFTISNELVKININSDKGTCSFIDMTRGDTVIRSVSFRCSIDQVYERGRDRLKFFRPVDNKPENVFSTGDLGRENRITKSKTNNELGEGISLRISSILKDENVLIAVFTIYPGKPYVDISWGFENLTGQPVRVNRADLLSGAVAFPDRQQSDEYFILDGNGGGPDNSVKKGGDILSYNNLLLCRKREEQIQSIVIGGMTYSEFVKFAEVSEKDYKELGLYAEDPVGKRIDPGVRYISPDRFYLEYLSPDPFEALELYGRTLRQAQDVNLDYYTFPSVCMWFLSVKHFGGDKSSTNDTPGAVKEMENAVSSGFLKYSPVCIRLVPDNYEQNNEQGWWDDKHWQMYGRKERCIVEGGHYKPPYETTGKWAGKITSLGGIPITYIEPGIRSEDYAEEYPEHMLFNDPHRYILENGKRVVETHQIMGKIYGKMYQESYDYTDTGFVNHIKDVYKNLRDGGVKGSFYDYPERAFPVLGGIEDKYSTAASHYRNVFRHASEGFGKPNFIQERNISMGSDITLGLVTSQRTQGDNNILQPGAVRSAGLRWYKNRSVINYDMDGKALLVKGSMQEIPVSREERRTILTMSYAVTGRLLLTESFYRFNNEVLHDLSRIYPFHSTDLSPRPVDAFLNEIPGIYDFIVSPSWHQLILYNDDNQNVKQVYIPLSKSNTEGGLALNEGDSYYIYDFWNNKYRGLFDGNETFYQELRKGEARVLALHRKLDHPQFISTDRHIMQGYVDLTEKPFWNNRVMTLSGVSAIIGNEPYSITIALNGYTIKSISSDDCQCHFEILGDGSLAKVIFQAENNQNAEWIIEFVK